MAPAVYKHLVEHSRMATRVCSSMLFLMAQLLLRYWSCTCFCHLCNKSCSNKNSHSRFFPGGTTGGFSSSSNDWRCSPVEHITTILLHSDRSVLGLFCGSCLIVECWWLSSKFVPAYITAAPVLKNCFHLYSTRI